MHLNSELIFKEYALPYFKNNMKILEIGPQGNPSAYCNIVNNRTLIWNTLDFDNSLADVTFIIKDEYHYPVEDNAYDIVLSGNVAEHVKKIWLWLKELKRIVVPGGYIITVNPVSWPYHEAPVDCWRIFPEGMKALCEEVNLQMILSKFESLEKEHFQLPHWMPTVPGESLFWNKSKAEINSKILWNKLVKNIPLLRRTLIPIEIAYDTITIARK